MGGVPLVTDIAPGYDHITSAIGATLAAVSGADFLCYVTPTEHLGLPGEKEVKEGVVASKIAAHAADISLGRKDALEKDREMSIARRELDWRKQIELSLDPKRARQILVERNPSRRDEAENLSSEGREATNECSMCGQYCAIKIARQGPEMKNKNLKYRKYFDIVEKRLKILRFFVREYIIS